jgi:hypothetical protein
MRISISSNIAPAVSGLESTLRRQIPFATEGAINDVAFAGRKALVEELRRKIDRPTPATLAAPRVIARATKERLEATIGLADLGSKSGAAGMDAQRNIGHHYTGGTRRFKQFEAAFARLGYLAPGENIVPASGSWAMTLNRYGNIPGAFVTQLISYFAGFGEQGYKANMTARRKKQIAKVRKSANGYRTINGVVYFVVPSRSRQAAFPRILESRFDPHLAPGIWAKRGIHGSDVAPVVLFVRRASYTKRLDMRKTVSDVVQREFAAAFSRRLAAAVRSAK